MLTKLILIRHGLTDYNLQKRYSGSTDIGLNSLGKKQAKRLCGILKENTADVIYCSDRKRALQTAGIIFKGRRIKKAPGLREINFGIFEGLNHKELMEKHRKAYSGWIKDPSRVGIPKGEKLSSFKKRVLKAMNGIVALNTGKTIAVVSHGGAISMFINSILGADDFWGKIPSSASFSIIEYDNGKPNLKIFNFQP